MIRDGGRGGRRLKRNRELGLDPVDRVFQTIRIRKGEVRQRRILVLVVTVSHTL